MEDAKPSVRRWPTARIEHLPSAFRAVVDVRGIAAEDLAAELIDEDRVLLTANVRSEDAPPFTLQLGLPAEADADRVRVVRDGDRLVVTAPVHPHQHRTLRIERAERLAHAAATG